VVQARLLRMKQRSDEKGKQLREEIQRIKSQKVQLQRKMKGQPREGARPVVVCYEMPFLFHQRTLKNGAPDLLFCLCYSA
jgi:hypothetical protein